MVTIRDFGQTDVTAVVGIEHAAHPGGHWKAEDYQWLSREPGGIVLVAECAQGQAVAGFVAARVMGSDAEMLNLAVAVEHRRRGIGRSLVEELHRRVSARGGERVFLEVRPSNLAAQQLYQSLGYLECGRRRNYYTSNGEDALVFELRLSPVERRNTAASVQAAASSKPDSVT